MLLLGLLAAAITFGNAISTYAAPPYAFDSTLSLTGDCSTSALDPIPDPAEPPCPAEPVGAHPPSGAFSDPVAIATDFYGDIYIASLGSETNHGEEGRIDIFDPAGHFLTEIVDESGPVSLAVDSAGNLYASNKVNDHEEKLLLYSPTEYEPDKGNIKYGNSPTILIKETIADIVAVAIDPANDHLFVNFGARVVEYGSAAESNAVIEDPVVTVSGFRGLGLAVDQAHGRLFVGTRGDNVSDGEVVKVFELAPPHALLLTIKGSAVPAGKFIGEPSVAVDEGTGHVFLYDRPAKKVFEFDQDGTYLSTIEHGFQNVPNGILGVDNGKFSPNGALSTVRYLFVPSNPSGIGHSYAFGPPPVECAPEVKSAAAIEVTESEATLQATVNPCNLATHYTFEYTTEQAFEAKGFAGAQFAGEGEIPAGDTDVQVAAPVQGLLPGTRYRFRILATNSKGPGEGEATFTTYPSNSFGACPNDELRTGPSALLPDCRAYELVTPPSTNARTPTGVGFLGTFFATREASPAGNNLSFYIEGGSVPGNEATGSLAGDPYRAARTASGWSTAYTGPTAAEAPSLLPGSTSPDQGYSFWETNTPEGTAEIGGQNTSYVRYPDGHSALIGRGSIADDPAAEGKLITEDGAHIIFASTNFSIAGGGSHKAVKLEEDSPPTGTAAVYDRTADEVTHVVSLLPGGITPAAGKDAAYQGASRDGEGIAFAIGNTLYLRYQNAETFEVGEGVTFAGVTKGGNQVFYLEGGNLLRFDVETDERRAFTTGGSITPVNVSADGSVAYFVSPKVLTTEDNPNGDKPSLGQNNLYLSREGAISFVGIVTEEDMTSGLNRWTPNVVTYGEGGNDPSRTTPDGGVLVFESRANLADYDPNNHAEVYRYDAGTDELTCLSCNPTGSAAAGEASLQSIAGQLGAAEPFSSFAFVANLTPDGRRVFFQSTEPLVAGDNDGLLDVYEWEADGLGSCARLGGCISLISSGHSLRPDYLYAVSDSGDDVFFRTSDLLLSTDTEETPSIYDARVGGGFPEPAGEDCESEGCRPAVTPAPTLPVPRSSEPTAAGKRGCPKGKRKVRRHGKTRCVKKHRKHHHRHRAGTNKKGAGK